MNVIKFERKKKIVNKSIDNKQINNKQIDNKQINKPDEYIIDELENLLECAKRGEVIGFAGVCLDNNNQLRNIYNGDIFGNYISIQGMLNDLSAELKREYES